MPELSKIEYKFELEKIEALASATVGKNLQIKRFKISETGDYDRGTYKAELVDIIFEEK